MSWNKKTDEQFKKELAEKRPDITTEDTYVTNKSKMLFTCSQGHSWYTAPNHILNDGSKCKICSDQEQSATRQRTHEEFVEILKAIGSVFTVIGTYTGAHKKVEVICDQGHTSFMTGNSISRGNGCRHCADYGKFRQVPTTLYYAKIQHDGKLYYKVGLTQKGFLKRFFGKEVRKMTLLYETVYDSPALAWEAEQSVLKAFKEFITKDKVLRKGNTEVFVSDVLHLDSYEMEEILWH